MEGQERFKAILIDKDGKVLDEDCEMYAIVVRRKNPPNKLPVNSSKAIKRQGIARLWYQYLHRETPSKEQVSKMQVDHAAAIAAIGGLQSKKKGRCRAAPAVALCMFHERDPNRAMQFARAFYASDNTNWVAAKMLEAVSSFKTDKSQSDRIALLELCIEAIEDHQRRWR